MRSADIERETKETSIRIHLSLDGTGQHDVSTGIGFLDHMLTHVAVHGLFDLTVKATGDLMVDAHHTVEDVALVLGQALNQALGDRKGIVRIGSCYVPMDETLAFVAVDLSGRPYVVTEMDWSAPNVGAFPVTLIAHFFRSFAGTARASIHARVLYGQDDHHRAEGLFKAFGRALDAATRLDPRLEGVIPSTKGVL
jgi:imidazoleglycerol-phosphate dehydratase